MSCLSLMFLMFGFSEGGSDQHTAEVASSERQAAPIGLRVPAALLIHLQEGGIATGASETELRIPNRLRLYLQSIDMTIYPSRLKAREAAQKRGHDEPHHRP